MRNIESKKMLEEYANIGLDKIRAKLESEPAFFEKTITALLIYWKYDKLQIRRCRINPINF